MRVSVLLFASYADALGTRALTLDLPSESRASAAVAVVQAMPGADRLPPDPMIAINERHSAPDARLSDGDVIALLPPVAGG